MQRKLSLEARLKRELEKVGKITLRDPRSREQMLTRIRWERLKNIIGGRYDN
mgnify:FL=1|jgi:hypothetical protein|tara:strand:- start:1158 stop:1313 length:156 start_codon:yes stop_codon:yes gene_type:complete